MSDKDWMSEIQKEYGEELESEEIRKAAHWVEKNGSSGNRVGEFSASFRLYGLIIKG